MDVLVNVGGCAEAAIGLGMMAYPPHGNRKQDVGRVAACVPQESCPRFWQLACFSVQESDKEMRWKWARS